MAKQSVINFRLNGIDQSIVGVESLKNTLGDLNKGFTVTSTNGEIAFTKLNTSIAGTDQILNQVKIDSDDLSNKLQKSTEPAEKSFDQLGDNISNVSNEFYYTETKAKSFGSKLEQTASATQKGFNGLARSVELVGGSNEEILQLVSSLQILGDLLKSQEKLGKVAFNNQPIKDQLKSIGELTAEKKALTVATEGQTVAEGASTTATEAGTVATKGFGAAMKALPIFAIIAGITAVVAAIQIFAKKTKSFTDDIKRDFEIINEIGDEAQKVTDNFFAERTNLHQEELSTLEKQLEVAKLQNKSLSEQEVIASRIVKKQQELTETKISSQQADIRNNKIQLGNFNEQLERQKTNTRELEKSSENLVTNAVLFRNYQEEITKSKEQEKEFEKKIVEETDKLNKNQIDLNHTQAELSISKQFDLKILREQNEEARKALKIQREDQSLSLKEKTQSIQKIINDTRIESENLITDEFIKRISFEENETKRLSQISDIELKRIEVAKITSAQVIEDFKQEQKEKRDEFIKTINDNILQEQRRIDSGKLTKKEIIEAEQFISKQKSFINEYDLAQTQKFNAKTVNEATKLKQEIIGIKKDTSKEQSSFVDSVFSTLSENINHQEKLITDELKSSGAIRIGLVTTERKEILKIISFYTNQVIQDLERQRTKEIETAENSEAVDKINEKYNKLVQVAKDKGKELSDSTKQFFNNATKELIGQVQAVIDGLVQVFNAYIDYQNQLSENQKAQIEKDFEDRQSIIDDELQQLADAQSAKEAIISESQSRIESLEDQLKNSRGKRHAFLLSLIDAEQKRLQQAQKDKQKLAVQEQKAKDEQAANEEKKKEEIEKIDQQRRSREKTRSYVQAVVSTAEGVSRALGSALPPFNFILAGLVAAAGAIQIATISEQKFAQGGQLPEIFLNGTPVTNNYFKKEKGGLIQGKPHSQGGAKIEGTNIEVEGGEFVNNKESTENNFEILERINKEGKTKKFKIVSESTNEVSLNSKGEHESSTTNKSSSIDERDLNRNFTSKKFEAGGILSSFQLFKNNIEEAKNSQISTNKEFNLFDTGQIKFPDFQAVQNVFQTNNSDLNLQPLVDQLKDLNISVSVKEITDVQDQLAKIKELRKV